MGQKNLVDYKEIHALGGLGSGSGDFTYVNAYVGHIDNYGVGDDCDYDGDVAFVDNDDDEEEHYFPVERRQTAFASDPSKNVSFLFA